MADIPDEEKLAIATHFLLSSPPAEVKEVLGDVKVVLNPPSLLTDGVLKGIFRKYNTQNFEVAESDAGPVRYLKLIPSIFTSPHRLTHLDRC